MLKLIKQGIKNWGLKEKEFLKDYKEHIISTLEAARTEKDFETDERSISRIIEDILENDEEREKYYL